MSELERARQRRQRRLRHEASMKRMRLMKEFDDFADTLLPAEDATDEDYDQITDCIIRSLCHRIGNRDELMEWVGDIADMWFPSKAKQNRLADQPPEDDMS